MLLEMGVRVWLPGTAFAVAPADPPADLAAKRPAEAAVDHAPPPMARPPAPMRPAPVPAGPAEGARVGQAGSPPSVALGVPAVAPGAALPATADWASLHGAVASCSACGLCQGRGHSTLCVPAVAHADWMVVGDPPDEDEDALGQAFASAAGELLDNMLKALGLQRVNTAQGAAAVPRAQAAYVTNIVKCRSPHGVQPQPADLAQCAQWLQREIALVQPRMILAMGRFANQVLLAETPEHLTQPLDRLRGQVYRYGGVPLVLTYHPKVLMRTPPNKAKAWADLCLAADFLDTSPP